MSAFTLARDGPVLLVAIEGQIVVANRNQLRDLVERDIEVQHTDGVVIDFQRCTMIDSAGMGMLVSLARKLRDGYVGLRFEHVTDDVRELFATHRVADLFRVYLPPPADTDADVRVKS